MFSKKRFAVVLLLLVLFTLSLAVPLKDKDTKGLKNVTIKCPKPHETVDGQYLTLTYTSRKPKGEESNYMRFTLYNDQGYGYVLKQFPGYVDGKEHTYKIDLDLVPRTKKYKLNIQELITPAPGKDTKYLNLDIPICRK